MARAGIDVNVIADGSAAELRRLDELANQLDLTLWVSAAQSRHEEPAPHDSHLAVTCDGLKRLCSVPVLAPPTGSPNQSERALAIAQGSSHRVARLCPSSHGYPLVDWALSPIPEICDRYRMTLLLDFAPGAVSWVETVAFARRYPSVPMVVLDSDGALAWAAPAALDATLNLILHVHPGAAPDPLVSLIETYGKGRFVAGSPTGIAADADSLRRVAALAAAVELADTSSSLADGSYASTYF